MKDNTKLHTLQAVVNQLEPENKQVFSYIKRYVTDQSLYEQKATEGVLIEIASHFYEAQKQGIKAKEVVGNNPKKYCSELGLSLVRKPWRFALMLGAALSWSVFLVLFLSEYALNMYGVRSPFSGQNHLLILLTPLVILLLLDFIYDAFRNTVNPILLKVLLAAASISVIIAIVLSYERAVESFPEFTQSNISLLIIFLVTLGSWGRVWRHRKIHLS